MRDILFNIKKGMAESWLFIIVTTCVFPLMLWLIGPETKVSFLWIMIILYIFTLLSVTVIKLITDLITIKKEYKLLEKVNEAATSKEKLVHVNEWEGKYIFTFKSQKKSYNIGMIVMVFLEAENEVEYAIGYGEIENIQSENNLIQVDITACRDPSIFPALMRNDSGSMAKITIKPHILKKYLESEYIWHKPK